MQPFKFSPEWKSSSEAAHSKDEKKKFQNSPEMKKLVNTMTKRLGFSQTIEFGKTNIQIFIISILLKDKYYYL
jgi:hypothetical protein